MNKKKLSTSPTNNKQKNTQKSSTSNTLKPSPMNAKVAKADFTRVLFLAEA